MPEKWTWRLLARLVRQFRRLRHFMCSKRDLPPRPPDDTFSSIMCAQSPQTSVCPRLFPSIKIFLRQGPPHCISTFSVIIKKIFRVSLDTYYVLIARKDPPCCPPAGENRGSILVDFKKISPLFLGPKNALKGL